MVLGSFATVLCEFACHLTQELGVMMESVHTQVFMHMSLVVLMEGIKSDVKNAFCGVQQYTHELGCTHRGN